MDFISRAFAANAVAARNSSPLPVDGTKVLVNTDDYYGHGVVIGNSLNLMGVPLVTVKMDDEYKSEISVYVHELKVV